MNSKSLARYFIVNIIRLIEVNFHLIDVTYIGKKICIAFHHAVCDGRGIKPFIETLIYYYCCLKYRKTFAPNDIRLSGESLLSVETEEPFGCSKYAVDNSSMPEVVKEGYALPENNEIINNYYRYEISIKQDQFIAFAKENNATPAILVALLASKAIKRIHPDADKPIVCNMASDMRKELGLDNTHKNCVGSVYLPYTEEVEKLSLIEQATVYRKIVKEQKQADVVKTAANNQIMLSDRLDQLETFEAKKQMMSFLNNLCINTFVISYLGQIQLGECNNYVDSMHLYSSGTKGLILNMISAGDSITIDLLQSFDSDQFAVEFMHSLDETFLEYKASQRIEFKTTCDKTFITGRWHLRMVPL